MIAKGEIEGMQRRMHGVGVYDGDIDGQWGPLSREGFDRLVEGFAPDLAPKARPGGWVWDQSEGSLYLNGRRLCVGYSGRGSGRNNPAKEDVRAVGPIPAGKWRIGKPRRSARTGPHIMDLTPIGHTAHGRSAFQIHGDNAAGDASSGCIILPRKYREQISASGLDVIEVVK